MGGVCTILVVLAIFLVLAIPPSWTLHVVNLPQSIFAFLESFCQALPLLWSKRKPNFKDYDWHMYLHKINRQLFWYMQLLLLRKCILKSTIQRKNNQSPYVFLLVAKSRWGWALTLQRWKLTITVFQQHYSTELVGKLSDTLVIFFCTAPWKEKG